MSGTQRQVLVKEWVSGESGAPPENKAIEKIGYIKLLALSQYCFLRHPTQFWPLSWDGHNPCLVSQFEI